MLSAQLFEQIPNHNSGSYGNIQRVLGTILGNLYAAVRMVNNLLLHPFHFVSHYDSILLTLIQLKLIQHDASFCLFYGINDIPFIFELSDGAKCPSKLHKLSRSFFRKMCEDYASQIHEKNICTCDRRSFSIIS